MVLETGRRAMLTVYTNCSVRSMVHAVAGLPGCSPHGQRLRDGALRGRGQAQRVGRLAQGVQRRGRRTHQDRTLRKRNFIWQFEYTPRWHQDKFGIATVAMFRLQGVKLRYAILFCTLLWLTNNILNGSIGGTVMESLIAVISCVTIFRLHREKIHGNA